MTVCTMVAMRGGATVKLAGAMRGAVMSADIDQQRYGRGCLEPSHRRELHIHHVGYEKPKDC